MKTDESFPFKDEIEITRDDVDEDGEVVNAIHAPNRYLLHRTDYVITIFKVRPHEYYQELGIYLFPVYSTDPVDGIYDPVNVNVITAAMKYGEEEVNRAAQHTRVGIHHVARLTRIKWFPVEFYNKDGVWVLDCEPLMDYEFARAYTDQIGSSDYKKWVGTKEFSATSFNRVKLTDVPLTAGELEGPGMPGWAVRTMFQPGWAK